MSETQKREESSSPQYPILRICASCQKFLGYAEDKNKEPGMITHTYCSECAEKLREEMRKSKEEKDKKKET